MSFTDLDLKQLKDYRAEHPTSLPLGWQESFDGLLARLEAAENPARGIQHNHAGDKPPHNLCRRCKADEAWRKECGK